MKPLNDKQSAFVSEYLKDYNATQAALRCGYSEKTAYAQGSRLLNHAVVAQAIEAAKAERAQATKATYDEAVERMTQIMRSPKPYTAIQACDRLAKLCGWDKPARLQTEDVTPPKYDLSVLSDAELKTFTDLLERVTLK